MNATDECAKIRRKGLHMCLFGAIFVLLLHSAQSRCDDDSIKKKLDDADKKYRDAMGRVLAKMGKHFDTLEKEAEKKDEAKKPAENKDTEKKEAVKKDEGKKEEEEEKQDTEVAKVKRQRKTFELLGFLPADAPIELRTTVTAQSKLIVQEYEKAITICRRAKKDKLAAEIQKAWDELQKPQPRGLFRVHPPAKEWQPLFNGKDLSKWPNAPLLKETWKVVDREFRGDTQKPQQGYIEYASEYDDFRLRMEVFCRPSTSATFLFRWSGYGYGYATNLATADITVSNPKGATAVKGGVQQPVNKWYSFQIVALANSITTLVDGEIVSDFIDPLRTAETGKVSVKMWNGAIRIRSMEIVAIKNVKLNVPEEKKRN